jgi:hypothetical protein
MNMSRPETPCSDVALPWTDAFSLCADTSPGATGPLAAPNGGLSALDYRRVIQERFRDPASRQHLVLLARHVRGDRYRGALPVSGPFADEARSILLAIAAASRPG